MPVKKPEVITIGSRILTEDIRDEWGRKVYSDQYGNRNYVDIDGTVYLMTTAGEPLYPVPN